MQFPVSGDFERHFKRGAIKLEHDSLERSKLVKLVLDVFVEDCVVEVSEVALFISGESA